MKYKENFKDFKKGDYILWTYGKHIGKEMKIAIQLVTGIEKEKVFTEMVAMTNKKDFTFSFSSGYKLMNDGNDDIRYWSKEGVNEGYNNSGWKVYYLNEKEANKIKREMLFEAIMDDKPDDKTQCR